MSQPNKGQLQHEGTRIIMNYSPFYDLNRKNLLWFGSDEHI